MPARNEIVPLDAKPPFEPASSGPARGTVPVPVPRKPKASKPMSLTNSEALSSQERRIRLVTAQKRHTNFQLFYALFGLALMIVQIEYLWFANTEELATPCPTSMSTSYTQQCPQCRASIPTVIPIVNGRTILHALRVLISFSTAILLYYVYLYYAAECEVMKIKNIVPPKATLLSSSLRKRLLMELAVLSVHPFPGLEAVDPRWPNLVLATSLWMFARVALLLRVVQSWNSFNSSNGWFIGALTNVDFTLTFFLKATLKNHPSRCILAGVTLLLSVAGYALYVVERFLCAFVGDSCCEPMAFADAIWALAMTILTIGHGDIVPRTAPGRFVTVLTGLFGTLLTAVTIAVMSNQLVLTRSEHKVNTFLKKGDNRRLLNDHAARSIQAFVQLIGTQRKHHHSLNSKRGHAAIRKSERKLFSVLQAYRDVKRHVNSHDVSDPMDKQMTMLEMMESESEEVPPEWALALEAMLQAILVQVGHVSSEVDAVKARVHDHIGAIEVRVASIEKKLNVQDAFHEITRSVSRSSLLKRDSFCASATGTTSASAIVMDSSSSSAAVSTAGNGSGAASLLQRLSRRTLVDQRRPSIRNFLTQRDLDEFQSDVTNFE
uniref:Potassium channel domain-containing protein n=1 Tax=Globisporangium ultimum (strain ATCC 200006 / CBS 805.95 / DAOM BR144) TaxID=431595 RepID=K3WX22_GLOUD